MYSGPTNGTAAELLQLINTVSEWSLSNTVRFSVDDMANFVVFSDPSLAPTVAPTATVTATAAVEEIQTPGQLGDQEFLCDFIKTTNCRPSGGVRGGCPPPLLVGMAPLALGQG